MFYDPLIAKLIVSGPTRLEALHAMHEALKTYQVVGPSTNLAFLRRLTAHPAFMNEELETGFIEVSTSIPCPLALGNEREEGLAGLGVD